jgi:hypothetical protein
MTADGTQDMHQVCRGRFHVMARGNQGRDIYADDRDRKLWLATLGEACEKTGWRIHAWVMMNKRKDLMFPAADMIAAKPINPAKTDRLVLGSIGLRGFFARSTICS